LFCEIVDNQDDTEIGPDDILNEQENGKLNIPGELDASTAMSTPSDLGKNRKVMESSIDMESVSDLESVYVVIFRLFSRIFQTEHFV
jgi:hypothetical protein